MTDKMREEFEAWAVKESFNRERLGGGPYLTPITAAAWQAWKASRAAVVVELPEPPRLEFFNDLGACAASGNMYYACIRAIEAAGVTVKKGEPTPWPPVNY